SVLRLARAQRNTIEHESLVEMAHLSVFTWELSTQSSGAARLQTCLPPLQTANLFCRQPIERPRSKENSLNLGHMWLKWIAGPIDRARFEEPFVSFLVILFLQ